MNPNRWSDVSAQFRVKNYVLDRLYFKGASRITEIDWP